MKYAHLEGAGDDPLRYGLAMLYGQMFLSGQEDRKNQTYTAEKCETVLQDTLADVDAAKPAEIRAPNA